MQALDWLLEDEAPGVAYLARVLHQPALDEALDHIEAKRGQDGRWKLDSSLNGKMLADVETKGQPSRWITLHSLTVLKHFGRI
jgi:hypothetical protein